jgi:O-antigen chain-terminating methyltransferase
MTSSSAHSHDEAVIYLDEAAHRASGGEPRFAGDDPGQIPPTIDDARRRVDEAWPHTAAGTEIPADARLKQVKRAMMLALRPVTSHQVPFNQSISVAVKDLATALDQLSRKVQRADRSVEAATARVHATLAAAEITLDDLEAAVSRLTAQVASLDERLERVERQVAQDRGESRALRARQDIVLKEARALVGGKGQKKHLARVAGELDASAELLAEDLADLVRGTRSDVRSEVEVLLDDVAAAAKSGPVVDLGIGRGEWLELLGEQGIEASGVDTSERAAKAARRRGLEVRNRDALAHLARLDPDSVAVVTAFHLVDRLTTPALLELLDRALVALRPGGLLIVSASNPTALDVGAAEIWLDPARRRPVHPQLLELIVLGRGFAEAEVRWLRPLGPEQQVRPEDLSAVESERAEALAERLNQALAGPRAYAVLARKP